jgi:hypothetical protein
MSGIDDLLKDAAPIRDEELRQLSLDGEHELLRGIVAQPQGQPRSQPHPQPHPHSQSEQQPQPHPHPHPPQPADTRARTKAHRRGKRRSASPSGQGLWRRLRRPHPRVLVGSLALLAAFVALALSGVSLTGSGELRTSPEHAWGAQALRVAGAVPRIAIGEDGWRVTRADEFQVDDGEMQFSRGTVQAQLTWLPQRSQRGYLKDRGNSSIRLADVEVLGSTATVYRYRGRFDDYTALWRSGRYGLEFRATAEPEGHMTDAQFVALLRSMKLVSIDEWLGAMPASVVLPDAREETVRAMLKGLPLPRGFDTSALSAGDAVRDRYQLGAAVSGAVACAWLDRWAAARRSGDGAAAQEAVDALATSDRWAILNEMNAEGDYPEVLWQYADAIAGDGTVMGGKVLTVQESYAEALGCNIP